jgi:hypothetical protein
MRSASLKFQPIGDERPLIISAGVLLAAGAAIWFGAATPGSKALKPEAAG